MTACLAPDCDLPAIVKCMCNKHYLRMRLTGITDAGPKAHASLEDRFWRKVVRGQPDDCWLWTGKIERNGYGRIQEGGKGSPQIGAHRLSYELNHGPIPEGCVVMHSCDNPGCVNPEHLSVGLPVENTADMIRKGRKPKFSMRGVATARAVLDADNVRYIRANPEKSHAELARELGVGTTTVRCVRSSKTWSHIT